MFFIIIAGLLLARCSLQGAQETDDVEFASCYRWGILEIKSAQCPVTLVFDPFAGIENDNDAIISLYENKSLPENEKIYCDIHLNPLVCYVMKAQSDNPDLQPEIEWTSQQVLSETPSHEEPSHIKSYKPFHQFFLFLQEHRGKVHDLVAKLELCRRQANLARAFSPHFLKLCEKGDENSISLEYKSLRENLTSNEDRGYYKCRQFAKLLCMHGYASTVHVSGAPMLWTNQRPSPTMSLTMDHEGNATFVYNGPKRHLTCTTAQARADVLARRREYESLQADSKSSLS